MCPRYYKLVWLVAFMLPIPIKALANGSDRDNCLLEQIKQADETMTVGWLRRQCSPEVIHGKPVVKNRAGQERLLVPYKRNYIAMGFMNSLDGGQAFSGNTADIKFEFGVKYQIFHNDKYKFLKVLKFGYSQKSWWDVGEESLPFAESNYNPELFLDFDGDWLGKDVNYQVGVEHESNGRGGPSSRSWNRAYAQGEIDLSGYLSLGLKLWDVVEVSDENRDITDYLGNARLNVKLHYKDRTQLNVSTIRGNRVNRFSYQVDFMYRPVSLVNTGFFLTYYNGYGEALISYNRRTESLRAGLVISYDDWPDILFER